MPRFQKWLVGVAPEAPADEVARRALTERLLAVSHFLDKSIGADDEAEAIHQLRVWTRRAATALALFKPAIPRAERKWMKKRLRKMRRRAGNVRDCDVHLQRLSAPDANVPAPVVTALKKQRRDARQRLKALRRRLQKDDSFQRRVERLLQSVAWPKRHSSRKAPRFASFCRQQIEPLADEFFKLGEADLHDDARLHALRIAGKRLRYALELAPSIMPARAHQQLYERLDELQDRLGDVVDQIAAIAHLQQWLDDLKKKKHRKKLQNLLSQEEQRLTQLRAKVLRWWSNARRARLAALWQQSAADASDRRAARLRRGSQRR